MASNKSKHTGGHAAQTRAGRGPTLLQKTVTLAEQEAIKNAHIDTHLRRARSLASGAFHTGDSLRRGLVLPDPDLVAAAAVSGKVAATEKERNRLKEYSAGVTLRDERKKDDDLKCRPKTNSGNGSGRPFVPWSKKC